MVIANCRANGIEVRDELKKRIIIKLDGGPALDLSPDWLQRQNAKGVIIFPGLPNGSSANQEMDQLYNFLKQTLADVRDELLKQRQKANEDIHNDQLRRRAAGEYGPTNKLVPETISNRQDLPTLLDEPLKKAMSPGHVNAAWMKVGAYPATRADMQGDGVQNGEATGELKTLIAENQRLAQELERNNIPNKFARQDLWVGTNNKLGSAVLVVENQDGGPFSSTGACVRVCVHACAFACVCCSPPTPSDTAHITPHCRRMHGRQNLAVGGCTCAHLGLCAERNAPGD